MYEKYKIKHDVYTYQHLIKMYLNMRDLDTLMALWDRLRTKEEFAPNQRILDNVLEGAIRSKNSDRMVEALEEYVKLKKEPPRFLLQKFSHARELPDRLYVILKENFGDHGKFLKKVREFPKATFREKNASVIIPSDKNHKRIRLKKQNKATLKAKDRKGIS